MSSTPTPSRKIDNFEQAVAEFQERVPELAKGLVEKIADAHKTNKKFQTAFDSFFTLCRQTLNPNISAAAVDEMLVQHLLTSGLFAESSTTRTSRAATSLPSKWRRSSTPW